MFIIDGIVNWFFEMVYGLLSLLLRLVGFIQSFFDVFAGTKKILYQGEGNYLINLFFGHDAVTNAFWAMALIAIVLSFGFAIVAVARKATDVTGTTKHTIGQIISNFLKGILIILLINAVTVAAINVTNVLLDRVNYALTNAEILDQQEEGRTFTDEEYATMARIYATIANYSINPSPENRYNINACYNEIRGDLYSLYSTGFFDQNYAPKEDGHHTWQSGLAMLVTAADLTEDLLLNEYNENITKALTTLSDELANNRDFHPVSKSQQLQSQNISTDMMIFLVSGMGAEKSKQYRNSDIDDALRMSYITGEKSYTDVDDVKDDFHLKNFNYIIGFVAGYIFLKIMLICIFTFIIRMFNLVLLYISAPLFVSSISLDEGSRFQTWLSSFVIQLFSGFGTVVVMRLYLIIVPIFVSSDLVFLPGSDNYINYVARVVLIIGGAWAVMQSSSVITGILAGNPGMAAMGAEAAVSGKVSGMVDSAASKLGSLAKSAPGAIIDAPATIGNALSRPGNYFQKVREAWRPNKFRQENRNAKAEKARNQREQQQSERSQQMLDTLKQMASNNAPNNAGGNAAPANPPPAVNNAGGNAARANPPPAVNNAGGNAARPPRMEQRGEQRNNG